jgi:selenocysteine lyase/cysteine desulfurase
MVDHDTRMIAVSAVSYLNAERADLTAYRQAADRAGATLVVDFTQAAGYSPIDASIADFAFSACYKWLLGTTGTCIAFWNRTRQPEWQPRAAGWHSLATGTAKPNWKTDAISIRDDALCFSCGNPAHLSIYMLQEGLKFLGQWETSEIKEHVQTLTAELLRRLDRLGMPSTTPRAMASHGASVTVECNGASEIVYAMSQAGVYAWNGRGRVRFSFHGYNCMADVDRIMDTFPALWKTFNGI